MLFVGGAGCYEVLRREPMLDSRLCAHLRFEALSADEVGAVIPVYHPVYADVPAGLIGLVDEQCAHGNFRNWAKFTHHALRLCEATGRTVIDDKIARNVFARLGGGFVNLDWPHRARAARASAWATMMSAARVTLTLIARNRPTMVRLS